MVLALLAVSTGSLLVAAIPASGGWPEVKVIDMHTHVFNARDLPLTGILNAMGAPRPLAVVVAEAFLLSMAAEEAAPNFTALTNRVKHPALQKLTDIQRNILRDYVGPERLAPLTLAADYLKVEPDVTLLAETLAKIGFPADDKLPEVGKIRVLVKAQELGESLEGYVRFIEMGPGTALTGFMKRIEKTASVMNVADVPSLEATVKTLCS